MWAHSKKALLKAISDKAKAEETGEMAGWRLHDLRRTLSTGMNERGILPHYVEAILNHIDGHKAGNAGVYNRATYRAQMAQALAMNASHLAPLSASVL